MNIGIISDLHILPSDNSDDMLQRIAADMNAAGLEAVIIGGDIWGTTVPHIPGPWQREVFARFLLSLEAPRIFVIAGNHDSDKELRALSAHLPQWYTVVTAPELWPLPSGATLLAVPYPRIPATVTPLSEEVLLHGRGRVAAAEELLVGHLDSVTGGTPADLMVGHFAVAGGAPGIEVHLRETEPVVDPADLQRLARCTVLGHLHKPRRVADGVEVAGPPWVVGFPQLRGGANSAIARSSDFGWLHVTGQPSAQDVAGQWVGLPPVVDRRVAWGPSRASIRLAYSEGNGLTFGGPEAELEQMADATEFRVEVLVPHGAAPKGLQRMAEQWLNRHVAPPDVVRLVPRHERPPGRVSFPGLLSGDHVGILRAAVLQAVGDDLAEDVGEVMAQVLGGVS